MAETLFFVFLLIFAVAFEYVWLALFGNGLQEYTDVVSEFTSSFGSNKAAEQKLVYLLALLGAAAIFLFYFLRRKKTAGFVPRTEESENSRRIRIAATAVIVSAAVYYLVCGGTHPLLAALLLLFLILLLTDRLLVMSGLIFFVSTLYGSIGAYRLYVFLGGGRSVNLTNLVFLSSALTLLVLFYSRYRKKDIFVPGFLLMQLAIPFSLLIFLMCDYNAGGSVINLPLPRRVSLFIWLVIAAFLLLALLKFREWKRGETDIRTLISYGTLCCIMNFNSYAGSGQIVSDDLHHPFENIIAFSQIFEYGQSPFSEYIPVSGFYSLLQGFFLWFFGKGQYAFYYVTENLFYFAFVLLIVLLLRRQLKNDAVLLLALLIPLIRYNRVTLILPVMLLLSWPKLMENRKRWLQAWLLTSLAGGLYYPVFGAAVCLGFLPLAFLKLRDYIKSDISKEIKTPRFWLEWGICFLPVLLSVPLLLGTLKHMLAMAGQTVYADGMSRFGQTVPASFLPSVESTGLRLLFFDSATFLVPAAVVWVSAAMLMKSRKALWSCFGIAVLVSFSYTLVRIDSDSIYARSAGIIYASSLMILLLALRYVRSPQSLSVLTALSFFFVALVSGEAFMGLDSDSKLEASYTVPDNCILVGDGHVPRLGTCFIPQETFENIAKNYDERASLNREDGYFGIGRFGHFYLSELKGDSVMENITVKGYGAAEESCALLKKNGTVCTPADSFSQYYLYHWLLCSGSYLWSPEEGLFRPNSEGLSAEEVLARHKNIDLAREGRELGRTPASWGSSMASLGKIFSDVPVTAQCRSEEDALWIDFDQRINGDEADFIYLEFEGAEQNYSYMLFNYFEEVEQPAPSPLSARLMKKDHNRGTVVTVSWADDEGEVHNMNCELNRGKLLFPLGSGCGWLFNEHDAIKLTATSYGESIALPSVSKASLLKLREVEE
ncbi:MAG: hypothetical protein IK115_01845 [Lachnospiraceae bacterium]|nr:hypothetical protein [Lachnospiraceae bacterium]